MMKIPFMPADYMFDIQAFHERFDRSYSGKPRPLASDMAMFRIKFLQEELDEYIKAFQFNDMAGMLDALVDLLYVTFGTAYLHGFDIDEAWRRVHAANMKKVIGTTHRVGGEGFDVAKPSGWVPADLEDLV